MHWDSTNRRTMHHNEFKTFDLWYGGASMEVPCMLYAHIGCTIFDGP